MTQTDRTGQRGGTDDCSRQEKLAESLIASLGFEGAVNACQANAWDGVLEIVRAYRDAHEAAGS